MIEIIAISIGLSMDAFAVSISNGLKAGKIKIRTSIKIASFFGFFQAAMPIAGWTIGRGLKNIITSLDHWVAFFLLLCIGLHMVYDAFKKEEVTKENFILNNKTLIMQSIATSIDALIVGTTIAFLEFSIISSVTIIGIVTFMFCFAGVYIGKKFEEIFKSKAEIAGGLILIAIGTKILLEHLG